MPALWLAGGFEGNINSDPTSLVIVFLWSLQSWLCRFQTCCNVIYSAVTYFFCFIFLWFLVVSRTSWYLALVRLKVYSLSQRDSFCCYIFFLLIFLWFHVVSRTLWCLALVRLKVYSLSKRNSFCCYNFFLLIFLWFYGNSGT